jgi:hypothetical protein
LEAIIPNIRMLKKYIVNRIFLHVSASTARAFDQKFMEKNNDYKVVVCVQHLYAKVAYMHLSQLSFSIICE